MANWPIGRLAAATVQRSCSLIPRSASFAFEVDCAKELPDGITSTGGGGHFCDHFWHKTKAIRSCCRIIAAAAHCQQRAQRPRAKRMRRLARRRLISRHSFRALSQAHGHSLLAKRRVWRAPPSRNCSRDDRKLNPLASEPLDPWRALELESSQECNLSHAAAARQRNNSKAAAATTAATTTTTMPLSP